MNSEIADLIYLDPPFNSKRMYSGAIGSKAAGTSFKDMWTWKDIDESHLETLTQLHPSLVKFIESIEGLHGKAMMSYILYMAQRLIELHRILKDTGSIYLHCDPTASHYLKSLMDYVFGKNNFRNEIVWAYRKWTNAASYFQKNHDVILCYSKNHKRIFFNKLYDTPAESQQKVVDKGYNVNKVADGLQLLIYNKKIVDDLIAQGKINTSKYIRIVDKSNSDGTAMNDIWNIQYLHSQAKERMGYPTQKPLALLHRIIKASCPKGGVVLDPFCGCATTCVAAQQLGRKWVGIDIEKKAVEILVERLEGDGHIESDSQQGLKFKEKGVDFIHLVKPLQRTDIKIEEITSETKVGIKNRLFKQQECRCNGCTDIFEIHHFEIDHIIPKAKGGADYFENYQLLCGHCNKTKGARPMEYLRMKIQRRRELLNQVVTFGE